jgi:murein DD-endopeptidase MepM/ murein hydrolase activator NlpD
MKYFNLLSIVVLFLSCTTKPLFRRPPKKIAKSNFKTIYIGEVSGSVSKKIEYYEEDDELLDEEINSYHENFQTKQEKDFFTLGKKAVDLRIFFTWPLSSRKITSKFGYRTHPITKKWRLHKGIDIKSPEGRPIFAAQSGTVIISKFSKSYGNIIAIAHSNGFVSLYGHNKLNLVKVGNLVIKNQKIGEVGKTGLVTGSHLHFEIRRYKKHIDPYKFLKNQKKYILN